MPMNQAGFLSRSIHDYSSKQVAKQGPSFKLNRKLHACTKRKGAAVGHQTGQRARRLRAKEQEQKYASGLVVGIFTRVCCTLIGLADNSRQGWLTTAGSNRQCSTNATRTKKDETTTTTKNNNKEEEEEEEDGDDNNSRQTSSPWRTAPPSTAGRHAHPSPGRGSPESTPSGVSSRPSSRRCPSC